MPFGRHLTASETDAGGPLRADASAMRFPQGTLLLDWTLAQDRSAAKRVAAVLFVAVLTAAAAQVSFPVPFTPVPFTLQPLVVLIGGAALGRRLGLAAQVCYILAGAAGLPVFAASATLPAGVARLLGPTGGYLIAYPAAAYVTGMLAERGFDRRYLTSVLAMAVGLTIIFAGGVFWLSRFTPDGLTGALAAGFYPFVLIDILKIMAGAAVTPVLWRFLTPLDGRA